MILIETLLVFLAFGVCFYTACSDWRTGIVSNKVLVRFTIPGVVLVAVYYGLICQDLLGTFLVNWIVITVISVLFYATRIWGGGDSKLMILLGMMIPARHYYYLENEVLPILSVVVIIFSVGYIYLIAQSIIYAIRKEKAYSSKLDLKSIYHFFQDYIIASIYLTFMVNMFSRIIPEFYYSNPVLFLFINMFVVMFIYDYPVFKSKWLLFICAISDLALLLSTKISFSLAQLGIYLLIGILFVIRTLISRYNYQTIPLEQLRPGMILSAANVMMMSASRIEGLPQGMSEDMGCRLSEEQVTAVLKWCKKKKCVNSITIVRKIPFAIFIAVGYGLFILLGMIR